MWRKPQPMIAASSSTKAGSNEARPSCAMPIKGVAIDWCEQPAAIDPGAEIGRDSDVGRRGNDARCQLGVAARELVEHQPKALLGRHDSGRLESQLLRHLYDRRGQAAAALGVERRFRQKC